MASGKLYEPGRTAGPILGAGLLGQRAAPSGGLTMAGTRHVITISRVAEMLGEDENLLQEISIDMDPEDGGLTILGPGEEAIAAVTHPGVDKSHRTRADGLRPRCPID
jgi:hypothetical protein